MVADRLSTSWSNPLAAKSRPGYAHPGRLKSGKHVTTANKAVLATHLGDFFRCPGRAGALFYFCCRGRRHPVIQGVNEGLAANRIERITATGTAPPTTF